MTHGGYGGRSIARLLDSSHLSGGRARYEHPLVASSRQISYTAPRKLDLVAQPHQVPCASMSICTTHYHRSGRTGPFRRRLYVFSTRPLQIRTMGSAPSSGCQVRRRRPMGGWRHPRHWLRHLCVQCPPRIKMTWSVGPGICTVTRNHHAHHDDSPRLASGILKRAGTPISMVGPGAATAAPAHERRRLQLVQGGRDALCDVKVP